MVMRGQCIDRELLNEIRGVFCTLPIVVIGIDSVIRNKGSKSPGTDGETLTTKSDAIRMVGNFTFAKLLKYFCKPIKRVYIFEMKPDGSIKKRPLGIPCISDRIVQQLFYQVLDPAIDVLSDPNSFGFRKMRSCHIALGKLARVLQKNPENRFILDYDIKSFFDEVSHSWIIEHFPMPTGFDHVLNS